MIISISYASYSLNTDIIKENIGFIIICIVSFFVTFGTENSPKRLLLFCVLLVMSKIVQSVAWFFYIPSIDYIYNVFIFIYWSSFSVVMARKLYLRYTINKMLYSHKAE